MKKKKRPRYKKNDWPEVVRGNNGYFPFEGYCSFYERLKGLEFTEKDNITRVFMMCNSVHTVGMKEPIDIAFVDAFAFVLAVYHDVQPGSLLTHKDAEAVLERFSSAEPWVEPGETLLFDKNFAEEADREEMSSVQQ